VIEGTVGLAVQAAPGDFDKRKSHGLCSEEYRHMHVFGAAPSGTGMSQEKAQRRSAGNPCHCTSLRKASRHVSQLYDEALAESGLKTTQRSILTQIERSEPTSVRGLAEAMVIDASAMAHTLKPLERDGLIAIGVDPRDKRNRQITLTDQGRARLAASHADWAAAQRSFEAALGKIESDGLREALRYLVCETFTTAFARERAAPLAKEAGR
jgi:DNA-binding MarR family transcriptional regulator